MTIWQTISQHITHVTGEKFSIKNQRAVAGGCINQTTQISDGLRHFFVKINHLSHGSMFKAEALALKEMADSHTVKVPSPICYGDDGQQCYLVLEYLSLTGQVDFIGFARQFSAMHKITHSKFGWNNNNTIGSTPQPNEWHDNWIDFWRDQRLGFQLKLAEKNGYGGELQDLGEKLLDQFPVLFKNYKPQASMLHGDLWGGNISSHL